MDTSSTAAPTPDPSRAVPHRVGPLRVGVVGAGRVGAVLAAALRAAGHEIVAAAGESDASPRPHRRRCCPGVAGRQAERRGARLRPAAAHRPRRHARATSSRCSPTPAPSAPGQYVVHTSGRHGLAVLEPAAARRRPPRRAAPGDDLHRHRRRPAPARRLRLRRHRRPRPSARSPSRSSPTSAVARCGCPRSTARSTTRLWRTAPTTWSRWSPRRWSCWPPAGADRPRRARCARCSPPRSTTRSTHGDAALTGPIVRGDVNTVRAHLADIAANAPAHAAVVRRHGARHARPGRHRRPGAADPRRRGSARSSTPR